MAHQNMIEVIENELRPLETAFENMLKQKTLKPETQEKIIQNLNAFSFFRTTVLAKTPDKHSPKLQCTS